MEPIDHDSQPIFGPTTVETLRSTLNKWLIDTEHQERAAAHTLNYGGFITYPQPHQGLNNVPLPTFSWLNQNNLAALMVSMNDVIYSCRPLRNIPPISTTTLTAALCQRFVTGGAHFKTQLQVKVTETEPRLYKITYSLAFAQNTNYKLTTTIPDEEPFLDPSGLCNIQILSLHTQSTQVLAAATTGDTFTSGCEAIANHILGQCHDTHHGFEKWVLKPGHAQFFLVPNAALTHTARLLATILEELLPMNHINEANHTNPLSTYYENHTLRPYLQVVLTPAFMLNMELHELIWAVTMHLICAFQTLPQWNEHHPHTSGSGATDTPASSSTAPVIPTTAPLLSTERCVAGTGPTTAKGPPSVAVPVSAFAKPAPPQPPDASFQG